MNLREVDLFGRSFKSPPHLDPSLQGAQLAVLETALLPSLEILKKKGFGLKARAILEFLLDFMHTSANGSGRVRQACFTRRWLGNLPVRYLRAVFSSIPALAAAASVLSVWVSFIRFLSWVSVTI